MTYIELHKATIGKEFVRKSTNKVHNRTEFYFDSSNEEILLALEGYQSTWIIRDKKGWRDGELLDKKDLELQTMYGE